MGANDVNTHVACGRAEQRAKLHLDDHHERQSLTGSEPEAGSTTSSSRLLLASPFTEAGKSKMTQARIDECHRAMTKFVGKGLHPFATVDAPVCGLFSPNENR